MMPSRAAERDRQIALAFANVVRKQVHEKIGNPIDEFHRLRKGTDVARHGRMAAGQLLETGDVVRVGKKSHVEYEVGIRRDAMAIAEAGDVHHDLLLVALTHELFANEIAQLMDRKF